MLLVPQKTQYALRAVFELAKRHGQGPVKIADIAKTQAIPVRFLEVILNQLKQAGFVESKRGSGGGYLLAGTPDHLTIGDVMQFVQGPVVPVSCMEGTAKGRCPLYGNCVFLPMWEQVQQAISNVYDDTTFQALLDHQEEQDGKFILSYSI
jgi:Rrf2 family cysteine metabolism transcriptional repressor